MFFRPRRIWLFSVALAVAGCLSPTLPLPPPDDPTVSAVSEGVVRLAGHTHAKSEVYALNYRSNLIFGQYTESGDYDFLVEAVQNDRLALWYVTGANESPPNDLTIKLDTPTP